MREYPSIFAHRGASGYSFENTFEAFEKAKELGADGIEIDVQQTSDNVYFVVHDNFLVRLAGMKRFVYESTAEEIKQVRLGKRYFRIFSNKRIPLLSDVLLWANEQKMPINLELKETILENLPHFEQMIAKLQLPEGSHISSFHNELLVIAKRVRPDIETALLITKKTPIQEIVHYPHIDTIHANKKYYTRQFLNVLSVANKKVRFYNIDGTEPYLEDPHPAVIGWITDYPDIVRKKIEK